MNKPKFKTFNTKLAKIKTFKKSNKTSTKHILQLHAFYELKSVSSGNLFHTVTIRSQKKDALMLRGLLCFYRAYTGDHECVEHM